MKLRMAAALLLVTAAAYADTSIPPLDDIPSILSATDKAAFGARKTALEGELRDFQQAGNAFNAKPAESQTDQEFGALQTQQAAYISTATAFNSDLTNAWANRVRDLMVESVATRDWTRDEKDRARDLLTKLDEDGDSTSSASVRKTWKDIQGRRANGTFAKEAAGGTGPGLPGSGNQTIHEDCAVFALANAAGVPYGVAAARATKVISDGAWRTDAERADATRTIEEGGLMGGEVILVAEALGTATLVPSTSFAKTLSAGQPVLVNLYPYNGSLRSGHETVLTKTFKHGTETWFEMIDSNEKGSRQRLYLSEKELGLLLKENGVSLARHEKSTPALLRK